MRSVLLFGVPEKVTKGEDGRTGETEDNPVLEAVRGPSRSWQHSTVNNIVGHTYQRSVSFFMFR